jgi:hypothetical protein
MLARVSTTVPALSVVAVFHEMRREAARTLVTLGVPYQRGIASSDFEVIAVDNGSRAPLRPGDIPAGAGNVRLVQEPAGNPSPCAAINRAVAAAQGEYVMVCIDGARMLSPGVLREALAALRAHARPFVYTLGMHLGPKAQNESMLEGYDQSAEDVLLAGVPWRDDGYRLFDVASLAYSSRDGYFGQLSESNCFALRREDFLALGGMDEAFASAGGGLVNLDFFNRAHALPGVRPVMLLGEATFHQFHGGVATNVPRAEHPWTRMAAEYEGIRGKPYANESGPPDFAGSLSPRYHAALMPAAPGS